MMQQTHDKKVARISREVRRFYDRKKPFYIYHGSTNSTRHLQFRRDETVDVSDLNMVLGVDADKRVATVEANVPMDALVAACLPHGLVPQVVMEFPGITVGGAIQGYAGESSSYEWGGFGSTAASVEMVLANGEVVTASPTEHSDLYYGAAGSYGSLGIIASAKIRLVPARKYVTLTYVPVKSFEQAVALLTDYSKRAVHDYIDGIMFSKTNGVVVLGQLSDRKQGRVERFTRAHDEWFYLHAEKISVAAQEYVESVPLIDYLFRYDRGAFWVGRYAYERAGWKFNRFTRWLLNPLLSARKLYQALHASGASQQYIVQDLALPVRNTVKFMDYVDRKFNAYPLWLCPLKLEKDWIMLREDSGPELVINVGVWDNHMIPDHDTFVELNRDLEAKLRELGGQKWFYAHAYYTEQEFWAIYNKTRYDKLRKKYHASSLPTIYDKVRYKGRRPVNIKKASIQTLFGRSKLKISDK